jgi:hypothetical protein
VNRNATALSSEKADYFHTTTAKLLFLSQQVRPELGPAVGFLTTRVSAPDEDDWKKLGRVIMYLRGRPHLPLTLEADDISVAKWSIDASFVPHSDMKSHTGGCATFGKGSLSSTSKKQKLNTRSSTEAELVAVDDMMGKVLWTQSFLKAQGYGVGPATIYQDNKSAILLETNGKRSSGQRTRHLNVRYFFVADRVKASEIKVEYCPTNEMVADMLTKPLQGMTFLRLRQQLLNLSVELSGIHEADVHRSVLDDIGSTNKGEATALGGVNKETNIQVDSIGRMNKSADVLDWNSIEDRAKEYTLLVNGQKIRYFIHDSEWTKISSSKKQKKQAKANSH